MTETAVEPTPDQEPAELVSSATTEAANAIATVTRRLALCPS